MKTIRLAIVILIASLSCGVSSSYASCPDSSYFYIKVTPANSDCASLCGNRTFEITLTGGGVYQYKYFVPGQNSYEFCVQGPITADLTATMIKVGYCKEPSTLYSGSDQTYYNFQPDGYAWASYNTVKYLNFNYCLE